MDGIKRLFSGMHAASTGLSAERMRIDVIARNIANAQTTRTPGGGPFRRQVVYFEPLLQRQADGSQVTAGVHVSGLGEDYTTPFERIYDPSHPDADGEGFVSMPNVNATREMADLISAVRAYEANLSVQESFIQMAERALRLAQ
jgi:flagellar basal-body rod protein FlgC